ncbi:MAG: hypothetical protein KDC26_13425, partial [Armatimonadetes bacterium]|nr:hypothetical protein [Armatimonadota bacterium]
RVRSDTARHSGFARSSLLAAIPGSHASMPAVIPGPRSGTRNPERQCRNLASAGGQGLVTRNGRHAGFRVPLRGPGMTPVVYGPRW